MKENVSFSLSSFFLFQAIRHYSNHSCWGLEEICCLGLSLYHPQAPIFVRQIYCVLCVSIIGEATREPDPGPRPAIVNSNMHNWVADISDWRQYYTDESRGFSGEYAFINGNGKIYFLNNTKLCVRLFIELFISSRPRDV